MTGTWRLDRALGRQVLAGNNKSIGLLEEVRAEQHGHGYVVTEYVIGSAGLWERLNLGVRALFGWPRGGGYIARWDQLDLTHPEQPRLTCTVEELKRA